MLSTAFAAASVFLAGSAQVEQTPAAWIRANAVPIKTPVAGNGFDDLLPLKPIIGDARIVSLGEPTHGTREAFQFKHRLLEFLVEEMGFTIFSIEANMPESYALTRYIQTGEGDVRQLINGMYFWTWNTEEVFRMVEWMRAWNASHPGRTPLQFTGFDMQTSDRAAAIAHEFIKAHAPDLADRAEKAFKDAGRVDFSSGPAGGFGSATGGFPVEDAKGKKLTFSAWIRTEGVTGWAGAWWRCDTPAGVGAFNNMQEQQIRGDSDWKRYEFTLDVNPDTQNINFGFLLNGEGVAWFDDVQVTLDGVAYSNPEKFSFDFENDQVRFLGGGGGGYVISRVETSPHSGKKCLEVRRKPEPALDSGAVVAEVNAIVAELASRRDALARTTSPKDADWAIQNARIVAQRASMFNVGMQAGSGVRDVCMADNVAWILAQNPGQKIVLWAHNAHVSKGLIWGAEWMGSHLEKKFPGEQVVVGFATGTGTYTAVANMGTPQSKLQRDNVLQAPPEGSVESFLASADIPSFVLDLRRAITTSPGSSWATEQRMIRSIGAGAMDQQFFPVVVNDIFDLIVWQAATSASQPVPPAAP
jgi:erythromycin esterase-like protein